MSPATQCFAPQAATATVDTTLKANKLTSANPNNDFMNKAPFRQANRTRQLLTCTGREGEGVRLDTRHLLGRKSV